MPLPADFHSVLNKAWDIAKNVPGFLTENEARFLGMAAMCRPAPDGVIVEIGSFKGKSTTLLAATAKHYGLPPVTAIDPHTFHSTELQD